MTAQVDHTDAGVLANRWRVAARWVALTAIVLALGVGIGVGRRG